MKREVVRNFLNLPGIVGLALMDSRSRPYFWGIDQVLNAQQREALVQGIKHVLETTPEDFESFEFRFTSYQLYIYKFDQGVVMLVLTSHELDYADYLAAIDKLKLSLEEDIFKAIADFRFLVSEITMSGKNLRWYGTEGNSVEKSKTSNAITPTIAPPPTIQNGRPNIDLQSTDYSANLVENLLDESKSPPQSLSTLPSSASAIVTPSLGPIEPTENQNGSVIDRTDHRKDIIQIAEVIESMNALSHLTSQYLGIAVIVNYWKSSRPKDDWFQQFEIERTGEFSLPRLPETELTHPIDPDQLLELRKWVHAFINRCSKVIRDFPALVQAGELGDRQRFILF